MFMYLITVTHTNKQTRICIPKVIAKKAGLDKAVAATIEVGKDGTLYIKEWKDGETEKRGFQED